MATESIAMNGDADRGDEAEVRQPVVRGQQISTCSVLFIHVNPPLKRYVISRLQINVALDKVFLHPSSHIAWCLEN